MCWKGKKKEQQQQKFKQKSLIMQPACIFIFFSRIWKGVFLEFRIGPIIFGGFTKMPASHTDDLKGLHKFLPREHLLIQEVKFLSHCSQITTCSLSSWVDYWRTDEHC